MFCLNKNISTDELSWKDYTLILPAISVGNLGQLAIDVLIATLKPEKIGCMYDESLIPVIGNDPYQQNDGTCQLSTCCDVYYAKKEKCILIQQRASFVKGKRKLFREKLLSWIKECQFEQVILISSTFAHMRTDQQITGSQFRYLVTDELKPKITSLAGWKELEDATDIYDSVGKRCPGSGIATTFYTECAKSNISALVVLLFCSEGDNAPDALKMVNFVNDYLHLRQTETTPLQNVWMLPPSWNLNFGNRFDQTLY